MITRIFNVAVSNVEIIRQEIIGNIFMNARCLDLKACIRDLRKQSPWQTAKNHKHQSECLTQTIIT